MRTLEDRRRDRILRNEEKIRNMDKEFHRACCPAGIKGGTSYNDYDTIHVSKKELNMEEWCEKRMQLMTQIELDKVTLESKYNDEDISDDEYLGLLETNDLKVQYLRIVKGYTQQKTADKLKMSLRHVQRIDSNIKKSKKIKMS